MAARLPLGASSNNIIDVLGFVSGRGKGFCNGRAASQGNETSFVSADTRNAWAALNGDMSNGGSSALHSPKQGARANQARAYAGGRFNGDHFRRGGPQQVFPQSGQVGINQDRDVEVTGT